jgi:hypothetical protein
MASLLRRAKSTRDTRRRGGYNDQLLPEGPFPFTSNTSSTDAAAAILPPKSAINASPKRSPSVLLKKRREAVGLGIIYDNEAGPSRRTSGLGRRKSISSTRESMIALGLSEEWKPPAPAAHANPAERKRRMSVFFGLASPAPHPKFPPPIEEIGMALGSPSESATLNPPLVEERQKEIQSGATPETEPAFILPPEPFVVAESPAVAQAPPQQQPRQQPQHQQRPKTGRSRKGSKGSDKSSIKQEECPEPPKTASWKQRIFGNGGLFRKNTGKSSREPTPEPPKLPKPQAKEAGKPPLRTPCIDITIPSVEMERYSVMFGNLLPPSEKSTLFARRRSKDMSAISVHSRLSEDFNVCPLPPGLACSLQ